MRVFGGMFLKRIFSFSFVFDWIMDLNICGVGCFYVVLDFIMYIVKLLVIVMKIEFFLYYYWDNFLLEVSVMLLFGKW